VSWHGQCWSYTTTEIPTMSQAAEKPFGHVEILRISEVLATQIVQQNELRAETRQLKRALNCDSSTCQGVLKNWNYGWSTQRRSCLTTRKRPSGLLRAYSEKSY
jgi:hypothetical protein